MPILVFSVTNPTDQRFSTPLVGGHEGEHGHDKARHRLQGDRLPEVGGNQDAGHRTRVSASFSLRTFG